MRDDIPSLNAGKAMAQAAHAANSLVHCYGTTKKVKEWQRESMDGFGTTIVLAADKNQIDELDEVCSAYGLTGGIITDETYPFIVDKEIAGLLDKKKITDGPTQIDDETMLVCRKEVTCFYMLVDEEDESYSEAIELLKTLPLHP